MLIASANRDGDVAKDPDRYDVHRSTRGHFGFDIGIHLCAGRWVAKAAVGETALPLLYERFPNLRVDERRTTTWGGWVRRGIASLPVTW